MAETINADYEKQIRTMVKMCMKGRTLNVAIQAAAEKKGKIIIAKKSSECKPDAIKKLEIFEGGKKADSLNNIKAPVMRGLVVGKDGILKIIVEKGPEKDKVADFAKYFITRKLMLKMVKGVEIDRVDPSEIKAVEVDDDDTDDEATPAVATGPATTTAPATGAPASTNGKFDAMWTSAKQSWKSASDAVDGQIASLQSAMTRHDDEAIRQIAQQSLNGVTSDVKVKMLAATNAVDTAADDASRKQAASTARDAINKLAASMNGDKRISVCDDNPFGVKVSIKKTLGTALAEMSKALKAC